MTGMSMPQQTWYSAAAGYLGIWMAMMVPMMLPSFVPMCRGIVGPCAARTGSICTD